MSETKNYPQKFMEQKLSAKGDKYLKLTRNVTVHGYTRADGSKTPDVTFVAGDTFVNSIGCPSEEDVAEAKSDAQSEYLKNKQEKWGGMYPESLVREFELVAKKKY